MLAPTPNYPAVANEFQYDLFTPELTISYVPDVFGLEPAHHGVAAGAGAELRASR